MADLSPPPETQRIVGGPRSDWFPYDSFTHAALWNWLYMTGRRISREQLRSLFAILKDDRFSSADVGSAKSYFDMKDPRNCAFPYHPPVKKDTDSGPVYVNDPMQAAMDTLATPEAALQLKLYKREDDELSDLVDGGKMHGTPFFNQNSFTTIDQQEAYVGDVACIHDMLEFLLRVEEFFEKVFSFLLLSYFTVYNNCCGCTKISNIDIHLLH